jgi:hypothetical protein
VFPEEATAGFSAVPDSAAVAVVGCEVSGAGATVSTGAGAEFPPQPASVRHPTPIRVTGPISATILRNVLLEIIFPSTSGELVQARTMLSIELKPAAVSRKAIAADDREIFGPWIASQSTETGLEVDVRRKLEFTREEAT